MAKLPYQLGWQNQLCQVHYVYLILKELSRQASFDTDHINSAYSNVYRLLSFQTFLFYQNTLGKNQQFVANCRFHSHETRRDPYCKLGLSKCCTAEIDSFRFTIWNQICHRFIVRAFHCICVSPQGCYMWTAFRLDWESSGVRFIDFLFFQFRYRSNNIALL